MLTISLQVAAIEGSPEYSMGVRKNARLDKGASHFLHILSLCHENLRHFFYMQVRKPQNCSLLLKVEIIKGHQRGNTVPKEISMAANGED